MAKKRELPLAQVYGLLEPGPVVLVTTTRAGRANHVKNRAPHVANHVKGWAPHVANIMPMSWHTMMEFVPPLVGCVVSSQNHTFEMLRATGEW
jgi:flavin reductase (DIM6/NTAB) family NADH-FMN oxidoreductase RutF